MSFEVKDHLLKFENHKLPSSKGRAYQLDTDICTLSLWTLLNDS